MTNENNALTGSNGETTQLRPMKINIRMQEGEHTGQPIYSNFTSVQGGQGVIIMDFGFLDPQAINALNRMTRSGEKTPAAIDAKLSCRMAVSLEAANHLAQQLNQLLARKTDSQVQGIQQDVTKQMMETASSSETIEEKAKPESSQGGFRFPWSKKTH